MRRPRLRDVTDSLRRTTRLMSGELQRQEATLRTLDEQGKSLKGTLNEHRTIDGTLGAGKRKFTAHSSLVLSISPG